MLGRWWLCAGALVWALAWTDAVAAQAASPTDATQTDTVPPGAGPAQTAPADATPIEAAPVDAAPVDAAAPSGPVTAPATPPPPRHDPEELARAKQHFKQGRAFADTGNCRGAIVEFQAAFDLVPRPSALYNIAQCQERMFRYDLAIEYYERFLQLAGEDDPDRQAVLTAIRLLRGLLATVQVQSTVPAEVWVGDRLAGEAPGTLLVPGGTYTVELRAKGYEPERREITVIGQQQLSVAFEMRALSTYEGLDPLYFYGTAGVSLALVAVGGVLGLHAVTDRGTADDRDAELNTRQTIQDIRDKQQLADIFFGAAGVVAVGATVLYFMTDWDDGEQQDSSGASARLQPVIGPGSAGLILRGSL